MSFKPFLCKRLGAEERTRQIDVDDFTKLGGIVRRSGHHDLNPRRREETPYGGMRRGRLEYLLENALDLVLVGHIQIDILESQTLLLCVFRGVAPLGFGRFG